MAEDKKISELTENPSIDGSEEIAEERGGSNYKNTFTDVKRLDSNICNYYIYPRRKTA